MALSRQSRKRRSTSVLESRRLQSVALRLAQSVEIHNLHGLLEMEWLEIRPYLHLFSRRVMTAGSASIVKQLLLPGLGTSWSGTAFCGCHRVKHFSLGFDDIVIRNVHAPLDVSIRHVLRLQIF